MQGTWALLLHIYSGDDDVVFGATTSGRPAELAGVESIVGLFINTLPVRVRVNAQMRLPEWLRELQEHQAEARQYEYSPLTQVQGWSDVPRGVPLFESLLVFENYPEDDSLRQNTTALKLSGIDIIEQTNYPLLLVVGPGERLNLLVIYDGRRYEAETINHMLGDLEKLLDAMTARPEGHLSDLLLPLREQRVEAISASTLEQAYKEDRFSF
jgi:non-ribosomal peptide synthetase component F